MKQVGHLKGNTIERVFHDKSGRLVRATFFVYESAGRIKARLLNFSYIETLSGFVSSLSTLFKKESKESKAQNDKPIASPFVANEILYFSGSKPRAPTI